MNNDTASLSNASGPASPSAFVRIASIARDLQSAIGELNAAPELQRLVTEIPDARDRLGYVGQMTENAAHRVLGLVEQAQPRCDDFSRQGQRIVDLLSEKLDADAIGEPHARHLLLACRGFAESTVGFSGDQRAVLGDIMLSQDFQDLSGQVIKRVIDVISRTERELLRLLRDLAVQAEAEGSLPAAPATPASERLDGPQTPDKAMAQTEVDDLLAELGF